MDLIMEIYMRVAPVNITKYEIISVVIIDW